MSIQSDPPKLYLSAPHACPYIEPETASTVMLDPNYRLDNTLFSILVRAGFRRSGDTIYRPHCRNCNACVSLRVLAQEFRPNRSQRRIWNRNRDLNTSLMPAGFSEEHFELYNRYQRWRHPGDIMDHSDPDRYREFMVDSSVETVFLEFRLNGKLVALAVCDLPDDGLSAVYTFYDPSFPKRSLGTYAILQQIEYVRNMDLEWLYLGYWIEDCRKMAYKTQFRPGFGFIQKEWRPLLV